MSDEYLLEDDDAQFKSINQFVIHPENPTGTTQVTIASFDVGMTKPFSSATTNMKLQPNKHPHNVSPATTTYSPQSGPHHIEF